MKFIYLLVTTFILFLIGGCSSTLTYYNSTAENSQFTKSILTEAELINWPENMRYAFGVVVATDRKTSDSSLTHYAVLVPGSSGVKQISDLRINYASPVFEPDLEYFASELDKILHSWSNKSSSTEATYYEFFSTPGEFQNLENSGESVWYPSVKFEFQNTEKNLVGVLTLGPASFKFKYVFKDMRELAALQMVLTEAIDEIRMREKK